LSPLYTFIQPLESLFFLRLWYYTLKCKEIQSMLFLNTKFTIRTFTNNDIMLYIFLFDWISFLEIKKLGVKTIIFNKWVTLLIWEILETLKFKCNYVKLQWAKYEVEFAYQFNNWNFNCSSNLFENIKVPENLRFKINSKFSYQIRLNSKNKWLINFSK
jgi:hypothetical protein